MDMNSLAHTKWNCKYHIVFAPKYRRKMLQFTPQCHLVSDKVGNFHGNKALVTFL